MGETPHSTNDDRLLSYDPMNDNQTLSAFKIGDASARSQTNPPHRILVADEDRDIRLLYSEVLAGSGYVVDEVEDGDAAWQSLQAKDYDLLITEHALPKLTGIQLVRKLRAAHMALPVVMAATTLPAHELRRDVSLQIAATLEKPFVIDALVNTVKSVLYAPAAPGLRL
jgi:DNA-binding response OmpR family regulator